MIKAYDVELSEKRSEIKDDIFSFLKSGRENCEIDISKYVNGTAARSSYVSAVDRSGMANKIKVVLRNKRLFLFRKEV